jgi:hypothetical protein
LHFPAFTSGATMPFARIARFVLPVRGEESMPLDLNRLFPIKDLPSARLMKLKAHCLFRAGVLSREERAQVEEKAKFYLRHRRVRAAVPPRRAA